MTFASNSRYEQRIWNPFLAKFCRVGETSLFVHGWRNSYFEENDAKKWPWVEPSLTSLSGFMSSFLADKSALGAPQCEQKQSIRIGFVLCNVSLFVSGTLISLVSRSEVFSDLPLVLPWNGGISGIICQICGLLESVCCQREISPRWTQLVLWVWGHVHFACWRCQK